MKLIITEKRSVAERIARALGREAFTYGTEFFESKEYIISWAASHLFELHPGCLQRVPATEDSFASSRMSDGFCPDFLTFMPMDSDAAHMTYMQRIKTLFYLLSREDINEVIHAGDASADGEVVVRSILHEGKCTKPVTRLYTASLTEQSILAALQKRKPLRNYDALAWVGYLNMYCNLRNGKRYVHLGLSEEENEAIRSGPLMR